MVSGKATKRVRSSLLLERLAAAGTRVVAGAHARTTHRAKQNQLHAARCADCIFLTDRRTTLGAESLAAGPAAVLVGLHLGMAPGTLLVEIEAALWAFDHLRRQFGPTSRTAKLQLRAAGLAPGIVLPHRLSAGRAERKVAIRAFSQAQPHVVLTPRAGPAGVKPAVGAGALLVFQ